MNNYCAIAKRNKAPAAPGIRLVLSAFLTIAASAQPIQALAQLADGPEITIRGFRFDPVTLEKASNKDLAEIGIDPKWRSIHPKDADVARWRILKFRRDLGRAAREKLRAEGLRLEYYVDGGYLEKLTEGQVRDFKESKNLLAAPLYYPEFKITPSLKGMELHRARGAQSEERPRIEGLLLLLSLFPDADIDSIDATLDAEGAKAIVFQDSRPFGGPLRIQFRLDLKGGDLEHALRNISRQEGVLSIEEVGEARTLNAPTAAINQSGDSTNPSIWKQNLEGEGQVISIVDNGVPDTLHCLFEDPSVAGNTAGTAHRKLRAIHDDPWSYSGDDRLHATRVAASAAGAHFDSDILEKQRGGAFRAKLYLSTYHLFTGAAPPSTLLAELAAASQYAHIHSNSWDIGFGYSAFARDFDSFSYQHEDHLVIAAAGTSKGPMPIDWAAPAISKNALTVSAASPDLADICAVYGVPLSSGRQKPDVAVVGSGILSAVPGAGNCDVSTADCATSYATPHAAALAALAREYFVDGRHADGPHDPSGALIKATLINAAQDISSVGGYPNEYEGWGAVTLDRALLFADDDPDLWFRDFRNADAHAFDSDTPPSEHQFEIASNEVPLKVTLVWTDPPASGNSDSLVNDLDLEVTPPNVNTVYLGNVFNPVTGESETGGTADSNNNVEQVLIAAPDPGTWILHVNPSKIGLVPAGVIGQGYALVVTAKLSEPTVLTTAARIKHEHSIMAFFRMLVILAVIGLPVVVFFRRRSRHRQEPDS